jgi:hypothetical protein
MKNIALYTSVFIMIMSAIILTYKIILLYKMKSSGNLLLILKPVHSSDKHTGIKSFMWAFMIIVIPIVNSIQNNGNLVLKSIKIQLLL